jgi:hypothetical protein
LIPIIKISEDSLEGGPYDHEHYNRRFRQLPKYG